MVSPQAWLPSSLSRLRCVPAMSLIAAAAIFFSWTLLTSPGLPRGSDISFHSQWVHSFVASLKEGVLYPRWVGDANQGYGAPVFVFYPPLGYYLVALAYPLAGDVLGALRLVLVAVAFLSGLAFYLAVRDVSSRTGAAIAAALYVLLPYHAIDLYHRFAFAEYVAFMWFPLIFLAVRRLSTSRSWGAWSLLAFSYGGLLFTHLVTAFMALVVLAPYALVRVLRTRQPRSLWWMLSAGVVALVLSAIVLLPVLVERGDVHLEYQTEGPHGNWRRAFAYSNIPIPGFGPDPIGPWIASSVTTQLVLAAGAFLVLAARLGWLTSKRRVDIPDASRLEGWMQLGLVAWTSFLQLPVSSFLWNTLPGLEAVQFPWRFGAFHLLSVATLIACALGEGPTGRRSRRAGTAREEPLGDEKRDTWPKNRGSAGGDPRRTPHRSTGRAPAWGSVGAILALAVIFVTALPALRVSARVMSGDARIGAKPHSFDAAEARDPRYRFRAVTEYIPKGVQGWRELGKLAHPGQKAVLSGLGRAEELAWTDHLRRFRVVTPATTRLTLRTFEFRGWQARIDGKIVPIESENPYGAIEVVVPAGAHEVEVAYSMPLDQRAGAAASAFGLLVGLALPLAAGIRRRRGESPRTA